MRLKKAKQLLLPALRQHQHNDCSGLIPAYDFEITNKLISELLKQRQETRQHEKIEEIDTSKLTRLTVVAKEAGRVIEKWDTKINLHVQDEGRTLKVFYE